jgi:hypothetical protein
MTDFIDFSDIWEKIPGGGFKRITAIILMTGYLFACVASPVDDTRHTAKGSHHQSMMVPMWFFDLPDDSVCKLAYGYSGVYLDESRKKNALRQSSAANLAKGERVSMKISWAGLQRSGQGLSASFVAEEGWQDRAGQIKGLLRIVREYRLEGGIIALAAACPDQNALILSLNSVNDTPIDIGYDHPPEWILNPISKPDMVYGVGAAPDYISPAAAWQEAERQARADLALKLVARHSTLQQEMMEGDVTWSQRLSETSAEITLKNVNILRHAYSRKDRTFYALAGMPFAGPGSTPDGK